MDNEKESSPPEQNSDSSTSSSSPQKDSKGRKELNVVSVPNDRDMIAEEMAELFEEDQVTHQHGNSEPEGD
ncbi:MAG: hypothetical protein NPIRA02_34070 [Nitrospirales bacterium]|nr:MAG: hypothetical protein NPIRA02_34070 [Nitrospirales bacterium]